MQFSSSSVLSAKAKALYGQRLKPEDYQAMMQKKTVSDLATYLKQNTYFSKALDGINEKLVHRGQLESLIRLDLFKRFSRMMRYVDDKRAPFYRYGIMDQEINQIMACIRSLSMDDRLSFFVNVPDHLAHHTSFKLEGLLNLKSYDQLLELLKGTSYYKVLKKYEVDSLENFDLNSCEIEFRELYLKTILELVKKSFKGSSKANVTDLFMSREELLNIQKIYRMKKYFNYSSERIKRSIKIERVHLTKNEINDLIEKVSPDDFFMWLKSTAYGRYIKDKKFLYVEYHIKKILYEIDKRNMRFNVNADIVVLAYMLISEMEVQNVIDVIEGIRYKITPDRISRYLVY